MGRGLRLTSATLGKVRELTRGSEWTANSRLYTKKTGMGLRRRKKLADRARTIRNTKNKKGANL